jgi:hypothetical protein
MANGSFQVHAAIHAVRTAKHAAVILNLAILILHTGSFIEALIGSVPGAACQAYASQS